MPKLSTWDTDMQKVPQFVDMSIDRSADEGDVIPEMVKQSEPIYPYGLSICLQDAELAKLGMDGNCEVGDMLHGHFLAVVKSVSKNDTTDGTKTRIELQISHLSAENEQQENEEADMQLPKSPYKKMYNNNGEY